MRCTKSAFLWVVNILVEKMIPFQIEGGFASRLYGSTRELSDIDISIPENRFDELMPYLKDYIIYGPSQYIDNEWNLKLMTLTYKGQDIDIAGAYENKKYDKHNKKWVNIPSDFSKSVYMDVYGLKVPIISKEELIAYKKIIARDVDVIDVEFLSKLY